MKVNKILPFKVNNLVENSIIHAETNLTVPAGQAPRGVYFETEHYYENCWYVKNHYADPNLIYGSSTIMVTDKFGELMNRKLLNHLVFRIKQSEKAKYFIALAFNLNLYFYTSNNQKVVNRDISKGVQNRYELQCVDVSKNGKNIYYSKSNSLYQLDSHLKPVQSWKIPHKYDRHNKPALPETQQALSILGLPKKFTPDDVKSAFRKNLIKVHPDVNPSDPFAADKTRKVIEAYEILTREKIDQSTYDNKIDFGSFQVSFGFESDGISATQTKGGTDGLYIGCYSGKIYLLFPSGKYYLIYDCFAPVRKIKENGKYLYIISDHFWDILLDGVSVNRISGMFRFNRILLEETCNAEILNHKTVRLYSPGGIAFGEVEFKDNVADAFLIEKKLKVVTEKKSFIFGIQPPIDYKAIAADNLFLP